MSLEQRSARSEATLPAPVSAPQASGRATLRALVLRVHFFAGLLVGPFLLLAALSGLLYTLTPALDQLVRRSALHVPAAATSLPLSGEGAGGEPGGPGGSWSPHRRAGTAPAHGAFADLSTPLRLGVLVVTLAVAWLLPVLGASLLAFVLIDVVLGRRSPQAPDHDREAAARPAASAS